MNALRRAASLVRGGAARWLFASGLMICTACVGFRTEREVGAPDGSFTPTRLELKVDGQAELIDGAVVTARFFSASGIQPLLGRFFVDPEYQSGARPAAILAHRYWTERFGSTPTIIGSTIEINGRSVVIVGIAPPTFQPQGAGVLWLPMSPEAQRIEKTS